MNENLSLTSQRWCPTSRLAVLFWKTRICFLSKPQAVSTTWSFWNAEMFPSKTHPQKAFVAANLSTDESTRTLQIYSASKWYIQLLLQSTGKPLLQHQQVLPQASDETLRCQFTEIHISYMAEFLKIFFTKYTFRCSRNFHSKFTLKAIF